MSPTASSSNPFRDEVVDHLRRLSGLDAAEVDRAVVRPPRRELGDFAFPCFHLAKSRRQAPDRIARELAEAIGDDLTLLESAAAAGPYVNFRVRRGPFAEHVLRAAIAQGEDIGRSNAGAGRVIAIDYCSPNIAKPFHVGHLRSTIIGAALYRIFEKLGYRSIGINHLGDWGTQFGKQIVGLERWGKPQDIDDLTALNDLYVRYHQAEAADPQLAPELAAQSRDWFRRQEQGDAEALELWRRIRETSLRYLERIFARLGVKFDHTLGESFYNDKMDAVIAEAQAKGVATVSQGALVIDLRSRGIETPAMLRKADGATLYMTRDLAAAIYRKRAFDFHKLLYVVGTAQSLHFQQFFASLELLGYSWAKDCVHVNFGMVQGMSTRKGNVVYLEELLDEAKSRALAYMRSHVEKRPETIDEEEVAEAVGLAAIIFSDLSKQRIKDYTFSWDHAISFEGDTGPYLLNAHARIAGIIRKCGVELDPAAEVGLLVEDSAHDLTSRIADYPATLSQAAEAYEPMVLANYLLELARALHSAYGELRVKGEEPRLARARLLLFIAVKNVLASGLRVLGLKPLETM